MSTTTLLSSGKCFTRTPGGTIKRTATPLSERADVMLLTRGGGSAWKRERSKLAMRSKKITKLPERSTTLYVGFEGQSNTTRS